MTSAGVRTYEAGRTSWAACLDPRGLVATLRRHRELLVNLVRRSVESRYRGSFLGVGWTVLQPLLMLAVYTFVFGFVFRARWGAEGTGPLTYALTVFCGLIPFTLIADSAAAAPAVVLANANYVKRVVFPLEILPVVVVGGAIVVALVNTVLLLLAEVLLVGVPSWRALLLPVAMVPTVLLALALAWGLAMLGVFVRDTPSVVLFATQVAFFVTPIVYPAHAVPESFRPFLAANPLAVLVETWRALALGLGPVPWRAFTLVTIGAALLALAARAAFVRAQRAFADVV